MSVDFDRINISQSIHIHDFTPVLLAEHVPDYHNLKKKGSMSSAQYLCQLI